MVKIQKIAVAFIVLMAFVLALVYVAFLWEMLDKSAMVDIMEKSAETIIILFLLVSAGVGIPELLNANKDKNTE